MLLLAGVLALLLVILLIVLLVPVRYQAVIRRREEWYVRADVTWLCRLLRIRVQYDKELSVRAGALFFLLYSTDEKWKRRREEKRKRAGQKKAARAERRAEKPGKTQDRSREADASAQEENKGTEGPVQDSDIPVREENEKKAQEADNPVREESGEAGKTDTQESEAGDQPEDGWKERNGADEDAGTPLPKVRMAPWTRFVRSMKRFLETAGNVLRTIAAALKKGRDGIRSLYGKLLLVKGFLEETSHREAFSLLLRTGKKFLGHIFPTRIRGTLEFGTGDPCSTGQVLGVLSVLYAKTGGGFTVIPDFEETRYEGEIFLRGRIRGASLLILVIRLITDPNLKQMLRDAKRLRGAL